MTGAPDRTQGQATYTSYNGPLIGTIEFQSFTKSRPAEAHILLRLLPEVNTTGMTSGMYNVIMAYIVSGRNANITSASRTWT